jgi:hypothetical protein
MGSAIADLRTAGRLLRQSLAYSNKKQRVNYGRKVMASGLHAVVWSNTFGATASDAVAVGSKTVDHIESMWDEQAPAATCSFPTFRRLLQNPPNHTWKLLLTDEEREQRESSPLEYSFNITQARAPTGRWVHFSQEREPEVFTPREHESMQKDNKGAVPGACPHANGALADEPAKNIWPTRKNPFPYSCCLGASHTGGEGVLFPDRK